eukprot:2360282-Pyramimonas_sp.AAC.1
MPSHAAERIREVLHRAGEADPRPAQAPGQALRHPYSAFSTLASSEAASLERDLDLEAAREKALADCGQRMNHALAKRPRLRVTLAGPMSHAA